MILQTEAIVLKTWDFRETSRIASFFTRDFGKVKGVLKGIRKDSKKFGSSLDQFSVNDIVYYKYNNSDFHLVSQCDLKEYFFPLRQDYRRNLAAVYGLELVNSLMPQEEENKDVYQLLLNYFKSLETARLVDQRVHMLQIKLLKLSGFRPHLDWCLKCRKEIIHKAQFSLSSGGLICQNCAKAWRDLTSISAGTIATILFIEQNSWENALRVGLTASVQKELKYLLNNFLVYHLERNIKSAQYL